MDKFLAKSDIDLTILTGGLIAALTYFLGGWDDMLQALVMFAIIDYVTGVLAAFKEKKVSSSTGMWGAVKKLIIFALVAVAHQLDGMTGAGTTYLRNGVLVFFIGNEGVSILENAGRLGVPIPPFIISALEKLHGEKSKPPDVGAKG